MDTVRGRHSAYARMDSRIDAGREQRVARFMDDFWKTSLDSTEESDVRDVEPEWLREKTEDGAVDALEVEEAVDALESFLESRVTGWSNS